MAVNIVTLLRSVGPKLDLFTTTKTLINSSEDEMGRGQTKVEEEEEDEEEAKTPSTKNSRGVGTRPKKKDLFSNELNLFLQIVNLIYLFYHFFSPHSLSSQFIRSEPNLN
ncbi:hypothetical protein RUM44_006371 [Polyplax serrata]|uniref:Uncharacterized protein n=1 Tax=Polyplax serrata TaxID=468196 RepID=A0ABR1AJM3_POLSC